METETWKPIPGHDGYEASDLGRIRSLYYGDRGHGRIRRRIPRILSSHPNKHGYIRVCLSTPTRDSYSAHALVLLTFVGPCPAGLEACHWDGNGTNNRLDNLRWDTRLHNHADQKRHGTRIAGEHHPNTTLTEQEVLEIRRLWAAGTNSPTLAAMFHVSYQTTWRIAVGKSWTETASGSPYRRRPSLSDETILSLYQQYEAGTTVRELTQLYHIPESSMYSLLNRNRPLGKARGERWHKSHLTAK
jgi:hypothetical protein